MTNLGDSYVLFIRHPLAVRVTLGRARTPRQAGPHSCAYSSGNFSAIGAGACRNVPEAVKALPLCNTLTQRSAARALLARVTVELLRNPLHGRIEARQAKRAVQVPSRERTDQPRQFAERSSSGLIGPEVQAERPEIRKRH